MSHIFIEAEEDASVSEPYDEMGILSDGQRQRYDYLDLDSSCSSSKSLQENICAFGF